MLANLISMGGGANRPTNEISYENHKKTQKCPKSCDYFWCRKNSKKSFLAILNILGVILTRLSWTQNWFFWKISFCKKSPLYMTIILCKKKWVLLEVHFYPFLGLFSRFKKAPLQAKQNNFCNFFLYQSVTRVFEKGANNFLEVISRFFM